MDAIMKARELGKAIQADERYLKYREARELNDGDEILQEKIGSFNLTRQNLQLEMSKSEAEKNSEKIAELNKKMQSEYGEIMGNVNMANFTVAKSALDQMINEINQIISMCCAGEDPDTCSPSNCGGSCATCGGCG